MNSKYINKNTETDIKLIAKDVDYLRKAVDNIDDKISDHYITRIEFDPIKRAVYGVIGLIVAGVITALIALVVS